MLVGIPLETKNNETRVAASPSTIKKLLKLGLEVCVAQGAGQSADFSDEEFKSAGAKIVSQDEAISSDIVFKFNKPSSDEISKMKEGSLLFSFLEPYQKDGTLEALAKKGVNAVSMELIPRTSRAQSMDALSSQAGIGGYRAVLEAAAHYPRFFPMMMTSAGSAKACRLVVLGAGVAGLQAIATARKLGATVEAYDVRAEVKEQIESLGAKFLDLGLSVNAAGQGGYAKELSDEEKKKQQAALTEKLKTFDVIISTANIPGKKAPTLITEDAVKGMKPGSVIVDMAAISGGNCPLSEVNKVCIKHGVKLIGFSNYPGMVAADASHFYSQNLFNVLGLFVKKQDSGATLEYNLKDDIVAAALIVNKGALCRQL